VFQESELDEHTCDMDAPHERSSFWGRGTASESSLEGVWKTLWTGVGQVSQRMLFQSMFPTSLCYYSVQEYPGVQGFVSLTVDDAPGQLGPQASKIDDVRSLLAANEAHATFFVISDFVEGFEDKLHQLVEDGHELANHCTSDRSFFLDWEGDFEEALLKAERTISAICPPERKWFRAPKGLLSVFMMRALGRHNYTHVLCDCYANDPEIGDAEFISNHVLQSVESGSIIIIHTPETGLREWNLNALELILEGLKLRQLQAVTLTELSKKAEEGGRNSAPWSLSVFHDTEAPIANNSTNSWWPSLGWSSYDAQAQSSTNGWWPSLGWSSYDAQAQSDNLNLGIWDKLAICIVRQVFSIMNHLFWQQTLLMRRPSLCTTVA